MDTHIRHRSPDACREPRASRRVFLQRTGEVLTTGALGVLAGCTTSGRNRKASSDEGAGNPVREVYVVAFHWGFRQLTPDGAVLDSVEMVAGTTLKINAVNLEPIAQGDDLAIPDGVYRTARRNYEDWEHASLDRIARMTGRSVEEWEARLETAEKNRRTHGLQVWSPQDETLLSLLLPAAMEKPATKTLVLDSTGDYSYHCQQYCGSGHPYMVLADAVSVRTR